MSRLQDLVRQILGKEPKQTNDTAKTATNLLQQPIQNAVGAAKQGFKQAGNAYWNAVTPPELPKSSLQEIVSNPTHYAGNKIADFAKTMMFPQKEEANRFTQLIYRNVY